MATWLGNEDGTIHQVYEALKAAGMLRGSRLDDQVTFSAELATHGSARRGAELAIALSALGPFDRLHIERDRSTGNVTVAKDTLEWKLKRLAGVAASGAYDDADWREWSEAVKAVGGPEALARWLVANGGAR